MKTDINGVITSTPNNGDLVYWIEGIVTYCQDFKNLDQHVKDSLLTGCLYDSYESANRGLRKLLFEQKIRSLVSGYSIPQDLKKVFKSHAKNGVSELLNEYNQLYKS